MTGSADEISSSISGDAVQPLSNARPASVRAAAESMGLIGRSSAIEQLRALIRRVGPMPSTVLLQGESGTGKEVVARALHDHSRRRDAPYVALNCGGLPDSLLDSELFGHEPGAFTGAQKRRIGRIEHANGGTLFLDELESMPLGVQVKLLRVLQERCIERLGSNQSIPVDVRVVAATKDDLLARAQQGSFRADLVYRLNVVNIELPALRERREDIPMLLEHFMLLAASRYGRPAPRLSPAQLRQLMARDWPGNVRELRNAADRLVLGLGTTTDGDAGDGAPQRLADKVAAYERSLIAGALTAHGGSLKPVYEQLGVSRKTLYEKMQKYGLDKNLSPGVMQDEI